jgi:lyso-ornithine lipid O-acyltransferase
MPFFDFPIRTVSSTEAAPGSGSRVLNRCVTAFRLWFRLFAFVVGTMLFWACMEVDFLLHRRTPRIDLINKWVPRWSKSLMAVFGIRVEARGPHADQGEVYPGRDARGVGRIFVANHQSGVDIPVLLSVIAAHAISRHDLATWPLIGAGGRRIGTLFVDRQSRRSGATVLRQVAECLAAGEGILMFPEGTSFPGIGVQEFKAGAFNAAHRAGAEVIPIGIAYDHPDAFFFKEPFLNHMRRIASRRRLTAAVEIGGPLEPALEPSVELKDHAHARVAHLAEQARQRLAAAP